MPNEPQLPHPGDSALHFPPTGGHESDAERSGHASSDSAIDMLPPEEQAAAGEAASPVEDAPVLEALAEPLPSFLDWTRPTMSFAAGDTVVDTPAEALPAPPAAPPGAVWSPRKPLPGAVAPSTAARGRPTPVTQRPSLLLIGLVSYASAATLALLYMYWAWSQPRPHALESLPDVPPLDVKNGEVMKLVPVEADVPPGHLLSLSESRRFGNIEVQPLYVVAEPLEFEHFSGRADVRKPQTAPVLKLFLRFTNRSSDQTIVPLDVDLLFRRTMWKDGSPRANQFVCRASERKPGGHQVLLYDHPATSEWDLSGQNLGTPLAPGESVETYLPSEEEISSLSGPLVWRVHFRKGYSPGGFGVTTLVDVVFDSSEIQTGRPAAGAGEADPPRGRRPAAGAVESGRPLVRLDPGVRRENRRSQSQQYQPEAPARGTRARSTSEGPAGWAVPTTVVPR